MEHSFHSKREYKHNEEKTFFTKFLIFVAFAIPVAIILYVLYINFLPFGYEKTYTLTIDENGVISPLSNEIYLTTPQGRKLLSLPEGVQGQVNLVLEPNVALKNANIEATIEGEGVYFATTPNLENIEWDYDWDFTQNIPQEFQGTATYNEEELCTHFNAYNEQTLYLPNSQDMFENGPMTIYVKWKPSSVSQLSGDNQQILGHYNWELWQDEKSIRFQVGRMNNETGLSYSINYLIEKDFFSKEHEILAIYSPDNEGNGYIEFWIDNELVERISIGSDKIYTDYNSERDLSFGWTDHNYGQNPYFDGCIYSARISSKTQSYQNNQIFLNEISGASNIKILGNGKINSLNIKVNQ